MITKFRFTPALLFLLIFSCSSSKIISDFDNSTNFDNYKTYGFSDQTKQMPVDDIIKNRILNSISSNLKKKGFSESDNPDVMIDLAVKTKNKKNYSNTNVNLSTAFGKKWRFRTGVGKTFSKEINYTEGSLMINLIDNQSQQLIWKGSMTDVVKEKNATGENIRIAIDKILESFPPQ